MYELFVGVSEGRGWGPISALSRCRGNISSGYKEDSTRRLFVKSTQLPTGTSNPKTNPYPSSISLYIDRLPSAPPLCPRHCWPCGSFPITVDYMELAMSQLAMWILPRGSQNPSLATLALASPGIPPKQRASCTVGSLSVRCSAAGVSGWDKVPVGQWSGPRGQGAWVAAFHHFCQGSRLQIGDGAGIGGSHTVMPFCIQHRI